MTKVVGQGIKYTYIPVYIYAGIYIILSPTHDINNNNIKEIFTNIHI